MDRTVLRLKDTLSFIQPLMPFIESHMVSFFTENIWEKCVPLSIQEEFKEKCIDDDVIDIFSDIVKNSDHSKYEELKKFVNSVNKVDIASQESMGVMHFKQVLNLEGLTTKFPPLEEFMNKKKSHEVGIFAEILSALVRRCDVSHVVEVGDGKGYASSLLALRYGINVLGLESSETNIVGAEKRKSKLHKYWNPIKNGPSVSDTTLYRQALARVNMDTNIAKYVKEKFPESWPECSIGISGLHTCGDLSPICLNLFLLDSEIYPKLKFLINIGCCYHLLSSTYENEIGFPLSSTLKKIGFQLNRNARMMSLLAPSKLIYSKSLPAASLMYRAVFEQLLDDTFGVGNPVNREVGRIGSKCKTFVEYARKASTVLGCTLKLTDDEIEHYFKKFQPLEKKIHFYVMLRAIVAPIIEGIILIDRLLFLKENHIENSYLVKLFDPVISPRCFGIIAFRDSSFSQDR